VLRIELERALPDPGPLPDLAVGEVKQTDGALRVEVLNFGPKSALPFLIRLEDGFGHTLMTQTVSAMKSAEDLVPGSAHVAFQPTSTAPTEYRVVVDPDDTLEEILEENNSATVPAR